MAWLKTLPSGKHQVCWRDSRGEEKARAFPADERREALRFKAEVEVLRARGEDWVEQRRDPLVDLPGLFKEFTQHQRHVRKLADSTGVQLAVGINLFIRYLRIGQPRGKLWPEMLDRERVEGFYVWMQTEREWKGRKGMSTLTAFQHTSKVTRAWAWLHARHPDMIGPAIPLDVPPAEPALRPRRHTWAECDAVIALARVEWHRRLMVACRFTGLRVGQVMRLLWADVDADAKTLRIRPELGKSRQERRGRTVPLAPAFVAELAGWGKREGFLIQTDGEMRRIDYEAFRRCWRDATSETDLRQPFHGFRKAFKQEMRRHRVADDVRDFLMGHAQGKGRGEDMDAVYIGEDPLIPEARRAVSLMPPIGSTREVKMRARMTTTPRRGT